MGEAAIWLEIEDGVLVRAEHIVAITMVDKNRCIVYVNHPEVSQYHSPVNYDKYLDALYGVRRPWCNLMEKKDK